MVSRSRFARRINSSGVSSSAWIGKTTDDMPFHFDVDPARPEFKAAYRRTLVMTLMLAPFLLAFLGRYRSKLRSALPYVFVAALTGLAYLLIEIVLIQRFQIFLGSPVVTFCTVLGTLLAFSGLGSLWSGHIGRRALYAALGGVVLEYKPDERRP